MATRLSDTVFDPGNELRDFTKANAGAGAIVSFSGVVRGDDGVTAMEIEHYPGMTERALSTHAAKAISKFDLLDAFVVHRVGRLETGEVIMMVCTAALHRKAAFEAADFLMDYLKSRAPFWKKEYRDDRAEWVEAKADDEVALSRWNSK